MIKSISSILLLLSVFACGDDTTMMLGGPDAMVGGPDAMVGGPDAMVGGPDAATSATIVTVAGDFRGNGIISTLSVPDMTVTTNVVAGVVGGDPMIRAFGERLIILDRSTGDSITVLNRDLGLVGQVTTGTGTNPQDVAVIGDTAYIATYEGGVVVVDLNNVAGGVTETISLAMLDTEDGIPDCNSIIAVGTRLYVSCQILTKPAFLARGNGKVAVIDTTDNSLEMVLDLASENPLALFEQEANGDLLLATVPEFVGGDATDGCLERITTSGTPAVAPCVSTNLDRGAHVNDIAIFGDTTWITSGEGFDGPASLSKLVNGVEADVTIGGDSPAGVSVCPTGHVVVTDNTPMASGIRVYAADGTALSVDAVDVGWPAVAYPVNNTICW